ncbi:MAG: diaminopimelate epimerase [Prevotellaceae bacterium]|jgi:diaminopimelate epimerase|nr:diaminopimelate epimerase [Prevotellaceae bacterium]
MNFIKMHGAGNDYIYVDCFKNTVKNPAETAIIVSDRHFGIGGDGLVLILPSEIADCKMRIFNADGSEAQMCGNAIRCVGKYFFENYVIPRSNCTLAPQYILKIETLSGIKTLNIFAKNSIVNEVEVNMGKADFTAKNIPVMVKSDTYINMPLAICHSCKSGHAVNDRRCRNSNAMTEIYNITAVSMGNPHCVVFCGNIAEIPLEAIGKKFEHHPLFPEKVNAEFVQIIDKQTIKMRVWERGSGETMACGTGACASVAAAVKNGLLDFDTEISVQVRGGELFIICKKDFEITMRGNAVKVFEGVIVSADRL